LKTQVKYIVEDTSLVYVQVKIGRS